MDFNSDHASLVRSLSVCLDPTKSARDPKKSQPGVQDVLMMMNHGSAESKQLWGYLQDLCCMVEKMKSLHTLSFVVSPQQTSIGFWIPRTVITRLIESLSPTCVNLEIDTRGHDFSKPSECHLCEVIHKLLPRLKHLRLRVSTLCPKLLEQSCVSENKGTDPIESATGLPPSLRTIVVNCALHSSFPTQSSQTRLCSTNPNPEDDDDHHTFYFRNKSVEQARVPLTECLREIVGQSVFPALQRAVLFDSQSYDIHDVTVYPAYNQRDVIGNVTWSMPFRWLPGDATLLRMPGKEFISYPSAAEALAEGEFWKDSALGSRLPSEIMARDVKELGAHVEKNLQQHAGSGHGESAEGKLFRRTLCTLWQNEAVTGVTLLDAVKREGVTDVLPIREITPLGWVRFAGRYGSELKAEVPE